MDDLTETVSRLTSLGLAALFELGTDTDTQSPHARQESLDHLLSIPIERAVNQLPRALAGRLRRQAKELQIARRLRESGLRTFGEMLRHPRPDLEMLKFAKDFGKAVAIHEQTAWPRRVGEVLNYAAYAAALVRLREQVGKLTDADLEKGFQQLASRSWISGEIKDLFGQARAKLAA
jgi:hypothetical protein